MFKKFDIFGSQINLRFNGQQTHKTNLGSTISIFIAFFITFRLFFIVYNAVQRTNPQVIYSERQVDNPALFSIESKYFPIAFAMEDPISNNYYIDESIYSVKARLNKKLLVFNSTSQKYDSIWKEEVINVKPCTIENFQNDDNKHYYFKLNYTSMYCLPPDYNVEIQGDFPSDIFSELILSFEKCKINCKPQDQIDYFLKKSYFGMQISDAYVDPTIRDYPFKIYSKDIFWSTSTQMPKDIYLFIRNNYVESDFGWFFSNIKTQIFPSYSYYEDSVYPEDFQDYFLKVVFRFEKQKESLYQRNYQDFNSIISQIGGFTQSLLAIGYLICRNFSSLKLNQSIVNSIFKYEDEEQNKINNNLVSQGQENKIEFLKQQVVKQPTYLSPLRVSNITHKRQKRNLTQIAQSNNKIAIQSNSSLFQELDRLKIKNEDQNNSFSKRKSKGINEQNNQHFDYALGIDLIKQQSEQKDQKQILHQFLENDFNSDLNTPSKKNIGIIKSTFPQKIFRKKQPNQRELKKVAENRFNSMFKQQTKSFDVSIWEYIKSSLFPCKQHKKKKEIINYSFEMLYQNLDILQILKRLIEVEKLKRLFLNEDQLKLFDYLPKPAINSGLFDRQKKDNCIQNQYEISLLYQDNRTELQRAKDAFDSYKKILNNSEQTELDEKLINMLDQNLIDIFEAENDSIFPSSQQQDSHNEANQISFLQERSLMKNEDQLNQKNCQILSKNQVNNVSQLPELKIDHEVNVQQQQHLNQSNFSYQIHLQEIEKNSSVQTESSNNEEVEQERINRKEIREQKCNLSMNNK